MAAGRAGHSVHTCWQSPCPGQGSNPRSPLRYFHTDPRHHLTGSRSRLPNCRPPRLLYDLHPPPPPPPPPHRPRTSPGGPGPPCGPHRAPHCSQHLQLPQRPAARVARPPRPSAAAQASSRRAAGPEPAGPPLLPVRTAAAGPGWTEEGGRGGGPSPSSPALKPARSRAAPSPPGWRWRRASCPRTTRPRRQPSLPAVRPRPRRRALRAMPRVSAAPVAGGARTRDGRGGWDVLPA